TQATLAAALAGIGSSPSILVVTFAGDGIWTLASSLTIPSHVTLWIPPGVTINRASGVTLTLSGPLVSFGTAWETGPGTTVRSLGAFLEMNRINARHLLVTNDTADAIVVRGAIASGAAVRLFVEQGGGSAGLSISRTDSSNASTWSMLTAAGVSLAFARPR